MSRELLNLVQEIDLKDIGIQMALQCAPLITGLKVSNLLIVSADKEEPVREVLNRSGISYYRLLVTADKITFLLFRRAQLERLLRRNEIRRFFARQGYGECSLGRILRTFQLRYETYMGTRQSFPHEMGLLLGYPLEDVRGFMENEGKYFLHAGYWKVYGNMPEKLKLFRKYEVAKETLLQLVAKGVVMEDIIRNYSGQKSADAAGQEVSYEYCDRRRA